MAIEDLDTKAALKRWIQREILPLPPTSVQGLGDRFASLYAEDFKLSETAVIEEGEEEPLPGTQFVAPEAMAALGIIVADISGSGIARLAINGVTQDKQAHHLFSADRDTVAQVWPLSLDKGDEVEVIGAGFGGVATFWEHHTNLTIVRLR